MALSKVDFEALAGMTGALYGHGNPDRFLRALVNFCAAQNPAFKPETFLRAVYKSADSFGQAWQVPTSEAELLAACERGDDLDLS